MSYIEWYKKPTNGLDRRSVYSVELRIKGDAMLMPSIYRTKSGTGETGSDAGLEHRRRKAELLDAAWVLFGQNGYDATTVNAIIERAGVSKGTFYHYFKSKEDLLDAIACKIVEISMAEIEKGLNGRTMDAREKLTRFFSIAMKWKSDNLEFLVEFARVIYRDENIMLRHKINRKTSTAASPLLAEIIREGIEEGFFDTAYPDDTAELLLSMTSIFAERNVDSMSRLRDDPGQLDLISRRLEIFITWMERILGTDHGLIERPLEVVSKLEKIYCEDRAKT